MELTMTKTLTRTFAILALIALSACATVQGIGTDLGNAGDAIADAAN
jgi:predicted small secreted protein